MAVCHRLDVLRRRGARASFSAVAMAGMDLVSYHLPVFLVHLDDYRFPRRQSLDSTQAGYPFLLDVVHTHHYRNAIDFDGGEPSFAEETRCGATRSLIALGLR